MGVPGVLKRKKKKQSEKRHKGLEAEVCLVHVRNSNERLGGVG